MKKDIQSKSANETKHTPGPWQANKWAPGYSISAPDSQYTVCNLSDCNNAEANARLIAAAPDMLEACQQIINDSDMDAIHGAGRSVTHDAIDKVRAAIAKARGEKS